MEVTGPTMYRALGIGMDRAFGDDVFRYSLCSFELQPLEQMLVAINRRLKRKKVFDSGQWPAASWPLWTAWRYSPVIAAAATLAWNGVSPIRGPGRP